MPILDLQVRQRELGRIRIGQKVGKNGRPEKLDRFRVTSASKPLVESVAAAYGGTVQPWSPDGTSEQWEVVTEARSLPILVPPQPLSQFYELWSGGGCQRRCDGITELLSDAPCVCGPDPAVRECKPTTRLNVVLRDVHGVGVFRLESHGYYAAVELPQTAAFLAQAMSQGAYLPARLSLEERVVKRVGEQTKRFIVPTIEVDVTPAQLMAGQGGALSIDGPGPVAIEAGGPAAITAGPDDRDWSGLINAATTVAETRAIWTEASHAGVLTEDLAAAIKARAEQITGTGAAPAVVPQDVDALWQAIVAACPVGWTLDDLETRFTTANDGTSPGAADPAQLQAFLDELRGVPA